MRFSYLSAASMSLMLGLVAAQSPEVKIQARGAANSSSTSSGGARDPVVSDEDKNTF